MQLIFPAILHDAEVKNKDREHTTPISPSILASQIQTPLFKTNLLTNKPSFASYRSPAREHNRFLKFTTYKVIEREREMV